MSQPVEDSYLLASKIILTVLITFYSYWFMRFTELCIQSLWTCTRKKFEANRESLQYSTQHWKISNNWAFTVLSISRESTSRTWKLSQTNHHENQNEFRILGFFEIFEDFDFLTVKISIMMTKKNLNFWKISEFEVGHWQRLVNYRRVLPRFCQSKSISRNWLQH